MPVYNIRKLINEKYGADRYALGCEIVARWLIFETKDKAYNQEFVQWLCNADALGPKYVLTNAAAEALRRLFGLKDVGELFEL